MSSRGGPWRATVVSAALLAALALGLLVLLRSGAGDQEPSGPDPVRAGAIAEQLAALSGPVPAEGFGDRAGSTAEARAWAERTWANLTALDAEAVTFTHLRAAGAAGDGLTRIDVMIEWTGGTAGLDARFPPVTVGLLIRPDGERYAIEGTTGLSDPVPLWLIGDLDVATEEATTLITVDGGPAVPGLWQRTREAAGHVRDRIDVADPAVVVVAPRDTEQAALLVGNDLRALEPIAALTVRLGGGSPGAETPGATAVVLNAPAFARMDEVGADIVLRHEAVHAMTDSLGRGIEPWAAEGFADYIALVDDERPATVIAADYLALLATEPPAGLPTAEEFASREEHLGTVYEAAWLVVDHLATEYGHAAVVDFYAALLAGEPLEGAVAAAFGVSLAEIEAAWVDHVTDLADD